MIHELQQNMIHDVNNSFTQEADRQARASLDLLYRVEESMFKQHSRDLAVNLGDGNTNYFYSLMHKRHAQSFISQIEDMEGNSFSNPSGIAAAFVCYFSSILGPKIVLQQPDLYHTAPFGYVSDMDAMSLTMPVTITEIGELIKAANPNKAPGPDGFNAHSNMSEVDGYFSDLVG